MTVAKATNGLQQAHQTIKKVAATMSLVADQLEAGQNGDPAIFGDTITFLRDLSEECHYHARKRDFCPLCLRPEEYLRPAAPLLCCITNTRRVVGYWLN